MIFQKLKERKENNEKKSWCRLLLHKEQHLETFFHSQKQPEFVLLFTYRLTRPKFMNSQAKVHLGRVDKVKASFKSVIIFNNHFFPGKFLHVSSDLCFSKESQKASFSDSYSYCVWLQLNSRW